MQGVFHASLLFLHFAFGSGTYIHLGDTAGQLGQTFVQFFAVVIAGRVFDLTADLIDATLDFGTLAGTFDDRCIVLVDQNLLGTSQFSQSH